MRPLHILLPRLWYYLRLGYSNYVGFVLNLLNFIMLSYTLVLAKAHINFYLSALLITVAIIPFTVFIGWLYMKRTRMYQAEVDVGVEANIYNRKAIAGKERDLQYPLMVVQLGITAKMMRGFDALSSAPLFTARDYDAIRSFRVKCQGLAEGRRLEEL